ncbi:MAG: hypothetical protein IPG44_06895 [Anaerolineales bacterium]|nr:hypothetical protein [Anaerolineales bacterium]
MNAETGEILVMASHPAFDPNLLDEQAMRSRRTKLAPAQPRHTGALPLGGAMLPVIQAAFDGDIPSDAPCFHSSVRRVCLMRRSSPCRLQNGK